MISLYVDDIFIESSILSLYNLISPTEKEHVTAQEMQQGVERRTYDLSARGKKKLTKDTMLFLGIEMAGRTKNATPKFFPRVVLELPYKEIGGGGGPKADDFF